MAARVCVCVRREDLTPFFLFIKDLSRRLKVKYLNISQKYDIYIYIYHAVVWGMRDSRVICGHLFIVVVLVT